jgi:hypothetical protein
MLQEFAHDSSDGASLVAPFVRHCGVVRPKCKMGGWLQPYLPWGLQGQLPRHMGLYGMVVIFLR